MINSEGRVYQSGESIEKNLKLNIINSFKAGFKKSEIKKKFKIMKPTIDKIIKNNYKIRGRKTNRTYFLKPNMKTFLLRARKIDYYSNKETFCKKITEITGKILSVSQYNRIFKILRFKKKRISYVALQRSSKRIIKQRKTFKYTMSLLNLNDIIFIDEVN
jgi:hypothetical protein